MFLMFLMFFVKALVWSMASVTYMRTMPPVLCEKIKYYEDAYFTKRLLPKVKIEALQMVPA
ncbi:hypothetical protein [Xanthomonas vesicatoria]|uniref:hypothetical protein n=1 Tax=Xanthomonas vesicatoria TaxID=56460 RepID=UPI00073231C0|nr:hypothetical protein [Xanthomonas vesicatoria]